LVLICTCGSAEIIKPVLQGEKTGVRKTGGRKIKEEEEKT
jgi:hypothetical protein